MLHNYLDYVQAKGFQLTSDFKNFMLFHLMERWRWRGILPTWTTRDHDIVSRLLLVGADPNDTTHHWNWSNSYGGLFMQRVSAFERFILNVPQHISLAGGSLDGLSLASTLKELLECKPDLGKRVLYRRWVEHASGSPRYPGHEVCRIMSPRLLQANFVPHFRSSGSSCGPNCSNGERCHPKGQPETESMLQHPDQETIPCSHHHATLILVRDYCGSCMTTERLADPLTFDCQALYGNEFATLMPHDLYAIVKDIVGRGEDIGGQGQAARAQEEECEAKQSSYSDVDTRNQVEESKVEQLSGSEGRSFKRNLCLARPTASRLT